MKCRMMNSGIETGYYTLFIFLLLLLLPASVLALAGDRKYAFQTSSGSILSAPAIGNDGVVYAGSSGTGKTLYAIYPDGTQKWRFDQATSGLASSPAVGSEGKIYVGAYDFYLYAINPDGTLDWRFRTGGYVNSSPAIGPDGTIYVGSGGYGTEFKLYAIYPDGTLKWSFDCAVLWSSPAVGSDGTIYIGSTDGNLYAVNPDGSEKWRFDAGDFIYASPAMGMDGTIYIGANNSTLLAINPDGNLQWTFQTQGGRFCSFFSPAIAVDGTIYAGADFPENRLYALNADGTEKWSFDTGEVYLSAPAIASDGTIYIGSRRKCLYAISPDGSQKWAFTTAGYVDGSPAIGSDGTVYVGSRDGRVYAIEDNTSGPAIAPWPMFHQNGRHTGSPDDDGDALIDNWEAFYWGDLTHLGAEDFDGDALNHLDEQRLGTNPVESDSDKDGIPDGWEVRYGLDPLGNDAINDPDADGFSNLQEYLNGYDPTIKAPEVQFIVQPASGYAPLTVALQGVVTGEVAVWDWRFGDGSSSAVQHPVHTFSEPGTFTIRLTATGAGGSGEFSTTVICENPAPVAHAGTDQTVAEGIIVVLNGSNSYDPNHNINTYRWTQIGGIPVNLIDDDKVTAQFSTPDIVRGVTSLTFQLTVTDSLGAQDTDTCAVLVSWVNAPPSADAGPDQTVAEGKQVILSGVASSDPDDGIAAYHWVQTEGIPVQLSEPGTVHPSFTSPDVGPDGKSLRFELTVTDKGGLKDTDGCVVNVSWSNLPPSADAGPDQTVTEGDQVILSGVAASDPDDGIAAYHWVQTQGIPVQLSNSNAVHPSFTAPDVGPDGGALRFELTVTDKGGLKGTDSCMVNVFWSNLPPSADAGPDQTVTEGDQVILNGANSYDRDDHIAAYQWTQRGGPEVVIMDADKFQASFIAPDVTSDGVALEFELRVTDYSGSSDIDSIIINTSWNNEPPTADAGNDMAVSAGELILLNGSGSIDQEGIESYLWRQLSGPIVSIDDPAKAIAVASPPDHVDNNVALLFELTVTDTGGLKAADTTIVNITLDDIPPVADAGHCLKASPLEAITLNGLNSSDPDGGIDAYEWKQIKGPTVRLSHPVSARTVFIAPPVDDMGVSLKFELTVTDVDGLKDSAGVIVNVDHANIPPTAVASSAQTLVDPETVAVTLYGGGSYDPDGSVNVYRWRQLSGPPMDLVDTSSPNATFSVVNASTRCSSFEFELSVADDGGLVGLDTTLINICPNQHPPFSNVGPDLMVTEGETVTIGDTDTTSNDTGPLTYHWHQLEGPQVVLSSVTTPTVTFIAPAVWQNPSELVFQLVTTGSNHLKSLSTASVFVNAKGAPTPFDNAIPFVTAGGQQVFLKTDDQSSLVALFAADTMAIADEINRPGSMPDGLIDMVIKVSRAGDQARLTMAFPTLYADAYQWYRWSETDGWEEVNAYSNQIDSGEMVELTLEDGGPEDQDRMPNGFIACALGPGTPPTPALSVSPPGGESGSGGGGCFIDTVISGWMR